MKNNYLLAVFVVFGLILSAGLATAAIEGCINTTFEPVADDTGAWPMYNDTGTITNVTEGAVCVSATDYNVTSNETYNCDEWYNYVDGDCSEESYWVGFRGVGDMSCTDTSWVATGTNYTVAVGYIVNTTIASAPNAAYVTNTGEALPAKDDCLNAYTLQGPTGYCDGASSLDTDSSLANVTEGDVCAAGSSITANSTLNCATWFECVADATSYATYYTGYAGTGANTCIATDWVATGDTYETLGGLKISFTANSATSCEANLAPDDASYLEGINNARNLTYAGFGLLAVAIIIIISFGLIQVFNGGNVDFMTLSIMAISLAVVLIIAYVIIYFVSTALGA